LANFDLKAILTAEDRASSTISKVGGAFSSLAKVGIAGAVAGVGALTYGLKKCIDEFSEAQEGIAQTEAVLKSTGGVAGVTAEEVTKLADSFSMTSMFTDDMVREGENLLLTFTNIGQDIFPQATQVMLDMSQALGQDVKSSAIQLGKALQDPILGITALRRVGVNFNDAAKDTITKLVETGRSGEAQVMILRELQTEFGGSAEAASGTFPGALHKLSQAFDNIKETIGKALINGLMPFVKKLVEWSTSDKTKEQVDAIAKAMGDWMSTSLPKAIDIMERFIKSVSDLSKKLNENQTLFTTIKVVLAAFAVAIVAAFIVANWIIIVVMAAIAQFALAIYQFVSSAQRAMEIFKSIWPVVKDWVINTWNSLWTAVIEALTAFWNWISPFLNGLFMAMTLPFRLTYALIYSIIYGLWMVLQEIWERIGNHVRAVNDAIGNFVTSKFQSIYNFISYINSAIRDLVMSVWDHIAWWLIGKMGEVRDHITNPIGEAKDKVGGFFRGIYDSAVKWIGGIYNAIKPSINNVIRGINELIRGYNAMPGTPDIPSIPELAHGGLAMAGRPYIVGEAGPELFVPSSSGRVIPNNQISNSISVNFTGNITNTSNASLDAIGERIGRSIQLNMQGF